MPHARGTFSDAHADKAHLSTWKSPDATFAVWPLDSDAALRELGKAANAEPSYRNQLKTLLDYLETGHLILREGSQILADQDAPAPKGPSPDKADDETPQDQSEEERPVVPGTPLPLLIQGLLQELPRGKTWSQEKADAWLDLAKLTFEMVYEFQEQPVPKRRANPDESPQ